MIENHFSLEDILTGIGKDGSKAKSIYFSGISTDSREKQSGALFIPLKGENFDAHDFIEQAIENGAKAVLSEKEMELSEQAILIKVEDTLKALQSLSHYWRKKQEIPVIALTGSNGKTSTKEFLRNILEKEYKVCYSKGSFNNHWGVPLSLLKIKADDQVMISEMGMNSPGEIARLCEIAEPNYTLVTNVGTAHIEFMKTKENIAMEKKQIYAKSPNSKKAFNIDNPYTGNMLEEFGDKTSLSFSVKDKKADVFLQSIGVDEVKGHIGETAGRAKFLVFGKHNVENLCAAISLAYLFGMSAERIWQAIPHCKTIWGRNQWVELESGAKALFDAYNANPESMAVFIENIGPLEITGKKYLVLGDMKELGSAGEREHQKLAENIKKYDWEKVYFIGENGADFARAYGRKNIIVSDTYKENLAKDLASMLSKGDTVFFKASRGIRLERFLQGLKPIHFENF